MSDMQTEPTITEPTAPVEPTASQPTDPAPTDPPSQPDTSWVPKRISEITAARRRAEEERDAERQRAAKLEEELAKLRQQPNADGTPQPTPAPAPNQQQFDQLVNARAEALARQQRETETLNQRIAAINADGTKEFGAEFDKAVGNLNMAGIGGPEFLKVLTSIDNGAKVVAYLGKPENMNEAIRIGSLDPVQMGIEMAKLSDKAAKAFAKQVSKAPAPIEPVTSRGNTGGDGPEPDPSDQKAWIAWRNKTARRGRR
jgi:hypothetical protein